MDTNKKIGLMFGSFNPPHLGHVDTAIRNREQHRLREVWLTPIPASATKSKEQASFDQKIEMCEITARPYAEWLKVSALGQNIAPSPIEQLRTLKKTLDAAKNTDPSAEFCIVSGKDFKRRYMAALYILYIGRFVGHSVKENTPVSFSMLEKTVAKLYRATGTFSSTPVLSVTRSNITTSSKIHTAIQEGREPEGLTSELLDYIYGKNLYSSPSPIAGP